MPTRAYTCTPAQQRFLSVPFPKIFAGGIGTGKTTAGVLQILHLPPETRGCVVAPTYTMLHDVVVEAVYEHAGDMIVKHDRARQVMHLRGDRVILFRSATHPERLRGLSLDWVWLDEATYLTETTWLTAIGRLRRAPDTWWLTCTPLRPSWVYDRFIAEPNPQAHIVHTRTERNPFLPRDYADTLRTLYGAAWAQRELDAQWIDLRGAVFQIESIRYSDALRNEAGVYAVMGIDLAAGTGANANYTAMVVLLYSPYTGTAQVEAAVRGRWTFGEQVEHARQLADTYQVRLIAVESNAYQVVFAQELAKRGYHVMPITARERKHDRIRALAPLYEMGILSHARRYVDLEAELASYPVSEQDDLLDALVYAWRACLAGAGVASLQRVRAETRKPAL